MKRRRKLATSRNGIHISNMLGFFFFQAAYLLSQHKNIVMCIQDIAADTVDNGNTVSIHIPLNCPKKSSLVIGSNNVAAS